MREETMTIKYLSLFSGIGGFELGLQNSKHDFECVGFSEIDKYAKSIYKTHFPNHTDFGDVTKIRTEDLPDFDLLVGGFPCQAFSIAGKRGGFDDTRGTLFFEIARVLKDKRPRYFLLENVRGLLSHDKGKTFKTILEVLSDLGYVIQWALHNSKDFSVPQRRERVFIEGYIREECRREVLSVRFESGKDTGETINPNQKINVENIKLPVTKRKHTANIEELQQLLRKHKKDSKLSNKKIAAQLELPVTQVEHWFRTDNYFGIPPAEIWYQLKDLLNISDTSFDKFITEFEEVEGVYDMSNRVYHDNGIAPTLKSSNRELICVNKGAHQAQKVYDPEGVSPTLSACGGGDGGKTGLYLVPDERKINVVANGSPTGHGSQNILSVDGLARTLTATDFKHPTRILEDNSKVKKIGSTNGHQSGNVYDEKGLSPALCCADYKSPVKILKLRESTKKGYREVKAGDGVELARANCTTRRGVSQEDSTGAINTFDGGWGTVTNDYRIRKLTPRECERLQAFPDDWTRYGVDNEEISDTQRYKCVGNAVTTTVITAIVNEMFNQK